MRRRPNWPALLRGLLAGLVVAVIVAYLVGAVADDQDQYAQDCRDAGGRAHVNHAGLTRECRTPDGRKAEIRRDFRR